MEHCCRCFVAAGIYLMLERHLLRLLFGLILLSSAVNLAILPQDA